MSTKMLVFIGVPNEESDPDSNLSFLFDNLNKQFSNHEKNIQFKREGDLISTEIDGIMLYTSILKSKEEVVDWVEMAKNFELLIDMTKLTTEILMRRYQKMRKLLPNYYSDQQFFVAQTIFEEMDKLPNMIIYSFQ